MNELTITQQYALCILSNKEKQKILYSDYRYSACIITSAFCELILNDIIKTDEKNKIIINKVFESDNAYLNVLYNDISTQKPKSLKKWIENYAFGISSKPIKNFTNNVINSLVSNNCLQIEDKKGILKNKKICHINSQQLNVIIEKIRAEFLDNDSLTDQILILTTLLVQSKLLKNYFSKYEEAKLKKRIKEIKNSPINALVKEVIQQIETILAVIATST